MEIEVKYNYQVVKSETKTGPGKYNKGLIELDPESTINDLFNKLNIPPKSSLLVLVNKKMINNYDYKLEDGDKLVIMPPIFGG